MPHRRHLPHINLRVFIVLVFVSLPLFALATVFVLGTGQAELREAYGTQLMQTAQQTAATIDSYVYRRMMDVAILARVPDVRAVAAAGNLVKPDTAAIKATDQAWASDPAAAAAKLGVLDNAASRFLRGIVEDDRVYREIVVTDREGRLVAASNPTSDYFQGDEAWWREAFDDGVRGRATVSDVKWDDSTKTHALGMAVPIVERPGERFVGILMVVADVRELLSVAAGATSRPNGEAVLIRDDGTLVSTQKAGGERIPFFAADLLRERLEGYKPGDPQFRVDFAARDNSGRSFLVGVAPSQLAASYPHLTWLVAVTQAEEDLYSPVRSLLWRLMAAFGVVAGVVLAIAIWFSVRLAAPPIEPDMHITEHPEVPRIEEDVA
jgi:hypothetical protein